MCARDTAPVTKSDADPPLEQNAFHLVSVALARRAQRALLRERALHLVENLPLPRRLRRDGDPHVQRKRVVDTRRRAVVGGSEQSVQRRSFVPQNPKSSTYAVGKYASVVGSNVMRLRHSSGMPRGYGYAAKSSTTLTVTFGEKKRSQTEEKGASEVEVSEPPRVQFAVARVAFSFRYLLLGFASDAAASSAPWSPSRGRTAGEARTRRTPPPGRACRPPRERTRLRARTRRAGAASTLRARASAENACVTSTVASSVASGRPATMATGLGPRRRVRAEARVVRHEHVRVQRLAPGEQRPRQRARAARPAAPPDSSAPGAGRGEKPPNAS